MWIGTHIHTYTHTHTRQQAGAATPLMSQVPHHCTSISGQTVDTVASTLALLFAVLHTLELHSFRVLHRLVANSIVASTTYCRVGKAFVPLRTSIAHQKQQAVCVFSPTSNCTSVGNDEINLLLQTLLLFSFCSIFTQKFMFIFPISHHVAFWPPSQLIHQCIDSMYFCMPTLQMQVECTRFLL